MMKWKYLLLLIYSLSKIAIFNKISKSIEETAQSFDVTTLLTMVNIIFKYSNPINYKEQTIPSHFYFKAPYS